MVKLRHRGIVNSSGQFKPDNPDRFFGDLKTRQGQRTEIIIQNEEEKVTVDQHAYLNGAIIPTALSAEKFGGWERDELRDFFKDRFLSETKTKKVKGKVIEFKHIPSLSSLSKKKMKRFIEKVLIFLAKEGIEVLDPVDYKLEKRRNE